jgi:hypothetical protein
MTNEIEEARVMGLRALDRLIESLQKSAAKSKSYMSDDENVLGVHHSQYNAIMACLKDVMFSEKTIRKALDSQGAVDVERIKKMCREYFSDGIIGDGYKTIYTFIDHLHAQDHLRATIFLGSIYPHFHTMKH